MALGIDKEHSDWVGAMMDVFPPWSDAMFISYDEAHKLHVDKLESMEGSEHARELAYAAILFDPGRLEFSSDVFRAVLDSPAICPSGPNQTLGAAWRTCKSWFMQRDMPVTGMPKETESYRIAEDSRQAPATWVPLGVWYMWPKPAIYVSGFHDAFVLGHILSYDDMEEAKASMGRIKGYLERAAKVCEATYDEEADAMLPVGTLLSFDNTEGNRQEFGVLNIKWSQLGLSGVARVIHDIKHDADSTKWDRWRDSRRRLWDLAGQQSEKVLNYVGAAR